MRLIGIDPGLVRTGWGVIEADGHRLVLVAHGTVATDAAQDLAQRLDALYRGLRAVLAQTLPAAAAIEETVVNRNAQSSLKLGHARAAALLACAHSGIVVAEYGAKRVKRSVVGNGNAGKEQVAAMVRRLLPGCLTAKGDAADALAVAICHAHHAATGARLAPASGIGRAARVPA